MIREADIEALVTAAINEGGNYPSPRFISEEECRGVLRAIRALQSGSFALLGFPALIALRGLTVLIHQVPLVQLAVVHPRQLGMEIQ